MLRYIAILKIIMSTYLNHQHMGKQKRDIRRYPEMAQLCSVVQHVADIRHEGLLATGGTLFQRILIVRNCTVNLYLYEVPGQYALRDPY